MFLQRRTFDRQLFSPESFWLWGTAVFVGILLAKLPLTVAAVVVGGTAVFLLTFIQPLVGLTIALLLGPFGALESVIFGPSLFDSGQVGLLLTLAAWITRALVHRRLPVRNPFLLMPLTLFVFVMGLTLLQAYSFEFGLRELIKWVEIIVVMNYQMV